jgi:hypothetical protein
MHTKTGRGLTAALVLAAGALVARAEDLTIVTKVTRNNEPPVMQTAYVSSERMRSATGTGEFMMDYATGTLTMIDSAKKEYSVVTPQDIEAVAAKMHAQQAQMEEQMKNIPPAMREKMGGMMGAVAAAVNVTKGTGGRTVAGYACENWVVTIGTMVRTDQCVTTGLAFPAPAFDAMERYAKAMGALSPTMKGMEQVQAKFKEMKGVPVYHQSTTNLMGKTTTETSEVVEVKKGSIPASAWAIPAGFKKTEWAGAKMAK